MNLFMPVRSGIIHFLVNCDCDFGESIRLNMMRIMFLGMFTWVKNNEGNFLG